jgi:ABC-2 type transport system permease protein
MPHTTETLAFAPPATSPRAGAADQARVFRRLRGRLLRNGFSDLVRSGRVKLVTMAATSGVVALFVFGLSLYGFLKLSQLNLTLKGLIVGGLFDLLFFTLGAMLLFSTGVILYASMFTAPESRFLLTTPARADRIFAAKFEAAVAFSSWGFVVLGLPVLVAYGLVGGVPWYFYPLLPLFLLGFVILPGAVSALVCLLLVRYLPRNRKQVLIWAGLLLAAALGAWAYQTISTAKRSLMRPGRDELEGFVAQFGLARHPAVPSHWMTNGIMAAARGEADELLLPLALIWSNGLFAYVTAAFAAGRLYRSGFDRIAGGASRKKVFRGNVLDRVMGWLVFYLDRPTRILVVKDFRTFRRDPTQWVLLVIFGGLMLMAAVNFRQYYQADLDILDKYILGLVKVGGTSVLLCAGLSRFIFPLISLEGRKFWILGLLPLNRGQILRGKFAFAATGSVLIAEGLIVGSDLLLNMSRTGMIVHALTVAVVAVGLSGLNVGLGAYMPNFRETDPSKIVVGFSGTVNMVIGLMYVILTVAVMAGPLFAAASVRHFQKLGSQELPPWVYAGLPIGLLLGAVAAYLPMRAGAKALNETEF